MISPKWAKAYALAVAAGALGWWLALLFVPGVKEWFLWPGMPEGVLLAFLPADILYFVCFPLAYFARPLPKVWNAHRFGVHYATALTVSLSVVSQGGYLGVVLMGLASLGAELVACPYRFPDRPIKAKPASLAKNIFKTLMQTAVMWTVFLVVLPLTIREAEQILGIMPLEPVGVWPWVVFWVAGLSGMYSGILFAMHGAGTPLPLDTTTRFVVLGLYRYIRNPMAFLGILQGLMVGLILRSPGTVAYGIAGAFVWHFIARPWEERDLIERFGDDYLAYRQAVRNWIPRFQPYEKKVLAPSDLADGATSADEIHETANQG